MRWLFAVYLWLVPAVLHAQTAADRARAALALVDAKQATASATLASTPAQQPAPRWTELPDAAGRYWLMQGDEPIAVWRLRGILLPDGTVSYKVRGYGVAGSDYHGKELDINPPPVVVVPQHQAPACRS